MNQKEYNLIASIFKQNINDPSPKLSQVLYTGNQLSEAMARQFADVLVKRYPNFDKDKFLKACGL